jgi:hypothetical protein
MNVRGPNSKIYETFVKFDLSQMPTGATILSALMCFDVVSTGQSNRIATTYQVNATWSESTITWNNKPAVTGGDLHSWDFSTTGWKNSSTDLLTLVQNWYSGLWNNYGVRLKETSNLYSTPIGLATKESGNKPYLKIIYTIPIDVNSVTIADAQEFLYANDEPSLKYTIKLVDLSKVIRGTWVSETIYLGDTVRVWDENLTDSNGNPLNVDVRLHKITKDLLYPHDIILELVNKSYNIASIMAKNAKQLAYAMPYNDNDRIVDANAIQQGSFGSGVG